MKSPRPLVFTLLALLLAGAALAASPALAQQVSPLVLQPVVPLTPQFNNPGPQIQIPKPGNPLQQLSPIESVRPRTVSPGVSSGTIVTRPIVSTSRKESRHHRRSAGAARRHAAGG